MLQLLGEWFRSIAGDTDNEFELLLVALQLEILLLVASESMIECNVEGEFSENLVIGLKSPGAAKWPLELDNGLLCTPSLQKRSGCLAMEDVDRVPPKLRLFLVFICYSFMVVISNSQLEGAQLSLGAISTAPDQG